MTYDDDYDYDYQVCEHGVYQGYVGGYCSKCDEYEEQMGGIDKCLRCGRYQWGVKLGADQCCLPNSKGELCQNPNEY